MPNPFNVNPINNYGSYKDAYKMFSQSKNPMQLFMNMASQNPNLQPIMNLIKSGKNPEMVFNQLCQQRGINPNEFLKNITG
jgi:hypothetical protein